MDKNEFRLLNIDFHEHKNNVLKKLFYTNYQQYNNKYWGADAMGIANHQMGNNTDLQWSVDQFKRHWL
jgi:hypothetical protein